MIYAITIIGAAIAAILLWDWYNYNHRKPKYTLNAVKRRIEEVEAEIEANKDNKDYPIKTSIDILDYWDSELLRIKIWNHHHPDDKV